MRADWVLKIFVLGLLFSWQISAQSAPTKIEVVSEDDAVADIIKALPDSEKVRDQAAYVRNTAELKNALGERDLIDLIDFTGGNEAAVANYPEGKLLLVEFANPKVSFDTDAQIKQRFNEKPPVPMVFYKRIGNYNAFILDAKDETAANAIFSKIKYQKSVKWLGTDPFYYNRAEKNFADQTVSLFFSTILMITAFLVTVLVLGTIAGFIFFRIRDKERTERQAFSDAGGMTRLNLDELTD